MSDKVVFRTYADCPPDHIYLMDPASLSIEVDPEFRTARVLVGPPHATPEQIEAAAKRFGVVLVTPHSAAQSKEEGECD